MERPNSTAGLPLPGPDVLVLSQDLAERIARNELEGHLVKTAGMQRALGNPLGVEIAHFGRAACFTIRGAPRLEMHRVLNLTREDMLQVEPIAAWFRVRGLKPQVDISPHQASPDLLARLAGLGLAQTGFLNLMFGKPNRGEASPPPGVEVEAYAGEGLAEFARLAVLVQQIVPADQAKWQGVIREEYAGWRCYVARVGGAPAGHIAMRIAGDTAVMMSAETSPPYRGFGCQTALLQRCVQDAAEAGCSLVMCAVYPGTTSQRNVERAGLRVAYTKALWSAV